MLDGTRRSRVTEHTNERTRWMDKPKMGTELEQDLIRARNGKVKLSGNSTLALELANKYKGDFTEIETKKIAEHYGGEHVFKIEDKESKETYLLIIDKETRIKNIINQKYVAKEIKDNAEKHAAMHHINELNINGLKIGDINEIHIDGNDYVIRQKITDPNTGNVTDHRVWLLNKDELGDDIKGKINRDSDFGQKAPTKAGKASDLPTIYHNAVLNEAEEAHLVQDGSKVVGWSHDGEHWAIRDTDGTIKVFSPTEEQLGNIDDNIEINAVREHAKLNGEDLDEVRIDPNNSNRYEVYDVRDNHGFIDKSDIMIDKDLHDKIEAEHDLPNPTDVKGAKVYFDMTDTDDVVAKAENDYKWARRRKKTLNYVLTGLEQINQAAEQESYNFQAAVDQLMHMGGGGNPNQNGSAGTQMTHALLKHHRKAYGTWKDIEKKKIEILKKNGVHSDIISKYEDNIKKNDKTWTDFAKRYNKAGFQNDKGDALTL